MIKWASVRYLVERSEREQREQRIKEQFERERAQCADLRRVLALFRMNRKT